MIMITILRMCPFGGINYGRDCKIHYDRKGKPYSVTNNSCNHGIKRTHV